MNQESLSAYKMLLDELVGLDENIVGMERQLELRDDEPWRTRCLFNLEVKRRRRGVVRNLIERHDQMVRKEEKHRLHLQRVSEYEERQMRLSQERKALKRNAHQQRVLSNKTAKEEAKNSQELAIFHRFKALVKEEIGQERYVELIQKADNEVKMARNPVRGEDCQVEILPPFRCPSCDWTLEKGPPPIFSGSVDGMFATSKSSCPICQCLIVSSRSPRKLIPLLDNY